MENTNEQEKKEVKSVFLTEKELKERNFDLYRLYQSSQVRESSQPQFDGMGYSLYNETNEMADMTFLAPKINKGDSRVSTGITHEKDSSLVSFFLNLNFEGNVRVFKGDKEEYDIGSSMTKLIRKSRQDEEYDSKRSSLYRNFVVQGTAFASEEYVEEWQPDKKIIGDINPLSLDEVKWVDKGMKRVKHGCQTTLIDGKKVFLENIREKDIQKQTGVFIVDYIPREQAESVWGKTKRWNNVPKIITPTSQSIGTLSQGSIYSDWILGEVDFYKLERIRVYRVYEQRYQIYLNGVPMLPCYYPLEPVSPKKIVPISKGDIDPINMFAYSKSEPAKTKIDQAVFDEILQNMLVKFRQSVFTPRANNTGKVLSPDMFLGGKYVDNIDPDEMPPLIDNTGITSSDFSFYKLFEEQIGNKTISSLLEGNPQGDMTLGQYMDMQKKQMLKIGGKIDGLIQWERQMLKLRFYNLLAHGYQKNDAGEYSDIVSNDSVQGGSKGTNVFKFTDQLHKSTYDVREEELAYEKNTGDNAEITYLNPELLKDILLNPAYSFSFEVIPTDKNNDKLTQIMFVQMISESANLFGIESLQVEKLKKQYASVMGKSFDDIFKSEQELALMQEQQQMAEANNPEAKPKKQPVAENRQGSSVADIVL